jgi:LETM1 and EF-hand domain-containing protein 1, mitochondrial
VKLLKFKVGAPKAELQSQLESWMKLSLDQQMPPTLLILSRIFSFTDDSEDAIKVAIGSLSDVVKQVTLSENEKRLEKLKRQSELIEEELVETPNVNRKLEEEKKIMEIREAIANASKDPLAVEKDQVEELMEDMDELKEETQSPEIKRISNKVSVLLQQLEENIENFDEQMNQQQQEFLEILDTKQETGYITVEEIRKFLQGPLYKDQNFSNEKIESIIKNIDRDGDGKVSLKQLIIELKESKKTIDDQ